MADRRAAPPKYLLHSHARLRKGRRTPLPATSRATLRPNKKMAYRRAQAALIV